MDTHNLHSIAAALAGSYGLYKFYNWVFPTSEPEAEKDGGHVIGEVLAKHGVKFMFTLSGGHISTVLLGAKKAGIRVIDTRHEVNAVFAADAVARLTGVPGVAAVTAGPGVSNTVTAIKNAQMAQSPLIVLGGATPTILKGRGSLQDIDQVSMIAPHVKWFKTCNSVKELVPAIEQAFKISQSGVPGPVFVELPLDVTWPESIVAEGFLAKIPKSPKSLADQIFATGLSWFLRRWLTLVYQGGNSHPEALIRAVSWPKASNGQLSKLAGLIKSAKKPVLLIGSGAMMQPQKVGELQSALVKLNIPTYLSGMGRGLLNTNGSGIQFRHKRRDAFKSSDLVIIVGVPMDFRLDYGSYIPRRATLVSLNRCNYDLRQNRTPDLPMLCDPCDALIRLAQTHGDAISTATTARTEWWKELQEREAARNEKIAADGSDLVSGDKKGCNPVAVCLAMEKVLPENAIIVADGGDFVGTTSYCVRPRAPLTWLDPGIFGTLGVGGGFALGAALACPDKQVVIVWGDGASGYSLMEYDTFVRHNIPVVGIIGNDASWQQIARDQVRFFKDPIGTELAHTHYEIVAQGFGAEGILIKDPSSLQAQLKNAMNSAAAGKPTVVNVIIGKSSFRDGSISV